VGELCPADYPFDMTDDCLFEMTYNFLFEMIYQLSFRDNLSTIISKSIKINNRLISDNLCLINYPLKMTKWRLTVLSKESMTIVSK